MGYFVNFSSFSGEGMLKIKIWLAIFIRFYFMYKLICQKPAHLLSAQIAVLSSFLQMFVVLGMYNFEVRPKVPLKQSCKVPRILKGILKELNFGFSWPDQRQNIASCYNFLLLRRYLTVTVQYCCSVSKAKHDPVFSAALLNGLKIQISLQLPDCDLTGCKYDPFDFSGLLYDTESESWAVLVQSS